MKSLNNGNGDNIYINNNPSLQGYQPKNGNHFERNKMLNKPGSFVPGHLAEEINNMGNEPLNWESENRRTDHNYQDGNVHIVASNNNYEMKYRYSNGQGYYDINYNNNSNNQNNNGFDAYPDGLGRHQRNSIYTSESRFEPYHNDQNYNYNYDPQNH